MRLTHAGFERVPVVTVPEHDRDGRDGGGHTVQTGGPYRCVRHPGYVGMIASALATGPALGSLWALIPAAAMCAMLVVRTALEDRTLREELTGYEEYTHRTRYRLLPGGW